MSAGQDGNSTGSCNGDRVRLARQWCTEYQGSSVLQRQHLFNVYIHPLPNFGSFPEESIFRGREIDERIQARSIPHCAFSSGPPYRPVCCMLMTPYLC